MTAMRPTMLVGVAVLVAASLSCLLIAGRWRPAAEALAEAA